MVKFTRFFFELFRGSLLVLALVASPLTLWAEEPDPAPAAISPPAAALADRAHADRSPIVLSPQLLL